MNKIGSGEDIDSILGEKLLNGSRSSIYRNGVGKGKFYLLWPDVEQIYIGGTKRSLNSIPTSEDRIIRFLDSSNKEIDFTYVSGFFSVRMKKENKELFDKIYSMIVDNISERQWGQFIQKFRSGERLKYKTFDITHEAIYFHKLFGKYDRIDIAYIKGCSIQEGGFYINYQEPNKKQKAKYAGFVSIIPNIQIVQHFLNRCSNMTF